MKLHTILDYIDNGHWALPEFQRGYVWNRDQVRGLMDSLYQGHPVGSLLTWATDAESADARGDQQLAPGVVKLLLDGQQRITSLYGIIRGRAPRFFDGNPKTFLDLYFHLEDESFEFYGPVKMKGDSAWISVTELMQKDIEPFLEPLQRDPERAKSLPKYMTRMNRIRGIRERDFHVEEITGQDKTVDVVVEIFNRVNSGGTKLSKGDLALAKICADWPSAREAMQIRLKRWRDEGFNFTLDWLLRNVNTVLTGEAMFAALRGVPANEVQQGLERAERHIEYILNLISSRLGLDHTRVLGSRYAIPLMARYVDQRGGQLENRDESDGLLYWYLNTLLWGRYAGSTETKLNQDLEAIAEPDGALERLVALLRRERGDLSVQAEDFLGWSRGSRFYPLIYLLTRVHGAKDWGSGVELKNHLLGKRSRLQIHHIFPKGRLYKHEYTRPEVNALANFTFLTQSTNVKISDRDPAEYLPEIAERQPGALESHWIPMDPDVWRIPRYLDFLAARRELLAQAANEFLEKLGGELLEAPGPRDRRSDSIVAASHSSAVKGGIYTTEEMEALTALNEWVESKGLPVGEIEYEVADEESSKALAILDLAWPEGLQPGLSEPVAVLIEESREVEEIANHAGFRFFTTVEQFRRYVEHKIIGGSGTGE